MAALGVALSAVVASPLVASIRPEDQQLAERFNLTLNDLGSGLRSTRPGYTKVGIATLVRLRRASRDS